MPELFMPKTVEFIIATPVLASLNIERSVDFFCSKLGFVKVHADQGTYGIVSSGPVSIHFWACTDRRIPVVLPACIESASTSLGP
jgi:hypothetical protein